METKPFYKKKVFVIPMIALFALAIVSASVAYFHSIQIDVAVTEARGSLDEDVSLSMDSGETETTSGEISNSANVPLCAELTWTETENLNGVTYTTDLPKVITLAPEINTEWTANISADEITEAGTVKGTINYQKVACS